jgi:hypothetical protein
MNLARMEVIKRCAWNAQNNKTRLISVKHVIPSSTYIYIFMYTQYKMLLVSKWTLKEQIQKDGYTTI